MTTHHLPQYHNYQHTTYLSQYHHYQHTTYLSITTTNTPPTSVSPLTTQHLSQYHHYQHTTYLSITTTNTPPTSVSPLPLLALQLSLNAAHQDATLVLCLTTAAAMSRPTGSLRHQNHSINTDVASNFLWQIGLFCEPVSQTKDIFASPSSVWSSKRTQIGRFQPFIGHKGP